MEIQNIEHFTGQINQSDGNWHTIISQAIYHQLVIELVQTVDWPQIQMLRQIVTCRLCFTTQGWLGLEFCRS